MAPYFENELCWAAIYDKLDNIPIEIKRVDDTYLIYTGAFGHHCALVYSMSPSSEKSIPLSHDEDTLKKELEQCKEMFFFLIPDKNCVNEQMLKGTKYTLYS